MTSQVLKVVISHWHWLRRQLYLHLTLPGKPELGVAGRGKLHYREKISNL